MRNHNILPHTPAARDLSKRLRLNMTKCESIFWEKTKKSQLGVVVRRQMPILDYVVDFYIKEVGLAIEIDGSSHDNMFLEDAYRQGRIESLGVRFIRFSNDQIETEIDMVLNEVRNQIKELKA